MARQLSHFWLLAALLLAIGGCTSSDAGDESADIADGDAANDDADADGEEVAVVGTPAKIKEGWGHLKGRFTITAPAEPSAVPITKDEAYCGKFMLKDESLIVGPDGGLANVVLFVNVKRGDPLPEPHVSYKASETANVLLDNLHCHFVPRVVLLRATQTLEIENSDPDPIGHNTKIDADPPMNETLAPGGTFSKQFKAQRMPAPVSCSIHPWMTAKLVVKDSPYMTLTNDKGEFVIENIPSGKWEFMVWQEALGYVAHVNYGGNDVEWARGLVEVTISGDATTDLGEVKLDYAKYE